MSSKSVSMINLSRLTILCIVTSQLVNSIPIDITNNGNIRNNNPSPPHVRHNLNHQHQHQQPIKTFLENEDMGRLHPTQNQFKRHSITPRDAKLTPGNFQQSPESFSKVNYGRSAYHNHDEFQQQPRSNHFRRQSQGNPGPGTRHGPFRQSLQNQIPSQFQDPLPWTNNLHPEEGPFRQVPDSFESHFHENILSDNGRIPNPKIPRDDSKYSSPYPMEHQKRFQETTSSSQLPSLTDHRQPAPSLVTIIVPGINGNPTLFIEYDVSDNDVTYETTVEVEEGAENNNVESNEI